MDISKASNFERFVFDLLGRDGARTAALFGPTLARDGGFTLAGDEVARLPGFGFVSGRSTHADRLVTIRQAWERHGTVIDTHTADGLKVAREHLRPGEPMLVLETALPAKFAATIREAIGREPDRPAGLEHIEDLPHRCMLVPVDVQRVKDYIADHA